VLHLTRQLLLYPASSMLSARILKLHLDLRDEHLLPKLYKMSPSRLLFALLQDKYLKDQHKLINTSKEVKNNLFKSLL